MTYVLQCTSPEGGRRPPLPSVVSMEFDSLNEATKFADAYATRYFMVRVINDSGIVVYDPVAD